MYKEIDSVFHTLKDPACALSTGARFVLVALAWHKNSQTGRCNPGATRLAAITGMAERNICRKLAELEKAGRITVVRVNGHSNQYTIAPPGAAASRAVTTCQPAPGTVSPRPVTGCQQTPDTVSPEQGSNRESEQGNEQGPAALREKERVKDKMQSSKKEPSPKSKAGAPSLTPEQAAAFEEFWKAYPRKVCRDKALEAWGRALRRAPAKAIVWAVNYQARARKFPEEERYIPYPAKWLDDGRWLDGFEKLEDLGRPKRARDTFYTLPD